VAATSGFDHLRVSLIWKWVAPILAPRAQTNWTADHLKVVTLAAWECAQATRLRKGCWGFSISLLISQKSPANSRGEQWSVHSKNEPQNAKVVTANSVSGAVGEKLTVKITSVSSRSNEPCGPCYIAWYMLG